MQIMAGFHVSLRLHLCEHMRPTYSLRLSLHIPTYSLNRILLIDLLASLHNHTPELIAERRSVLTNPIS